MESVQQLETTITAACESLPMPVVASDIPVEECLQKLVQEYQMEQDRSTKVQLDLQMQIAELQLRMRPVVPLAVQAQRAVDM